MEMKSCSCLVLLLVPAVLFLLSLQVDADEISWSYVIGDEKGPNNWPTLYPEYCSGSKQSPINIDTKTVERKMIGDFTLVGFGKDDIPVGTSMSVENNGHTVEIELHGDYLVSEGGLPEDSVYKAVQFHFHWGSSNDVGSEHKIDGKQYAAEMHIVCYDTKYSAGLAQAVGKQDGLTVLGFLIDVQAEDNVGFAPLIDLFTELQFQGTHGELSNPLAFADLLPSNMTSFYRYSGSLTTPTCNEVVVWNVFTNPIMLSEAQLLSFRSLYKNRAGAEHNESLVDTFRPIQPLNGRTVYLNDPNASSASFHSMTSLISLVVLTLLTSGLMK